MRTGILFDLDGTLLDTLEDLADAVNYTMDSWGYPRRTLEEVRRFVGNGARRLITLAVPENGDAEGSFRTFQGYYDTHCRIKTRPYAGIPKTLAELAGKYPLAIVSNKPDSAVKSLCDDYFPGIYALGETAQCPRKPEPDMVFKAMEAIGVDRCVYVGDSEVDVLTAKNAGVPCLSVLWGFRDRKEMEAVGGKYFCSEPRELTKILQKMIAQSRQSGEKDGQ